MTQLLGKAGTDVKTNLVLKLGNVRVFTVLTNHNNLVGGGFGGGAEPLKRRKMRGKQTNPDRTQAISNPGKKDTPGAMLWDGTVDSRRPQWGES